MYNPIISVHIICVRRLILSLIGRTRVYNYKELAEYWHHRDVKRCVYSMLVIYILRYRYSEVIFINIFYELYTRVGIIL